MKPWTKAVAWFWLAYGLYAGVCALVGSVPPYQLGGRLALSAGWHDPEFKIGFDVAALAVVIASLALLGGKAWGWWVVLLNASLTVVMLPIGLLVGDFTITADGSPGLRFGLFTATMAPVIVTIWALTADPPWKWVMALADESVPGDTSDELKADG